MSDLEVGSVLANRYRIDARLGEGGMAVVYRAYDLQRRAMVAIKSLKADYAEDETFVQRFQREARNLQRLQHPNIVRFYEFAEAGLLAFMVLDYVDGVTLRRVMRQRKQPFLPREVLRYLHPICAALSYAHRQGVIHCDMKPANVMVDDRGGVYLSDFGIARLDESATVTFSTPGTAAYMAPEQWRGGGNVCPATDVYALGVMLYEMLTGQQPFTGETIQTRGTTRDKVMREHFQLMPPPASQLNPQLPPAFDAILLKCLAKSAEERYQGADRLLEAFEAACRQLNIAELQVPPLSDRSPAVMLPSLPSQTPPLPAEQERMLDAAIAQRVPVNKATQLVILIRRKESVGLQVILKQREGHGPTSEDVKTSPFHLEFPLDGEGKALPIGLRCKVISPDFEPRSQERNLLIYPGRDSDLYSFLLTPKCTGTLVLSLELYKDDYYIASGFLETNGELSDQSISSGSVILSMPLFVVSTTVYNVDGDLMTGGVNIRGDATIGGNVAGRDHVDLATTGTINAQGGTYLEAIAQQLAVEESRRTMANMDNVMTPRQMPPPAISLRSSDEHSAASAPASPRSREQPAALGPRAGIIKVLGLCTLALVTLGVMVFWSSQPSIKTPPISDLGAAPVAILAIVVGGGGIGIYLLSRLIHRPAAGAVPLPEPASRAYLSGVNGEWAGRTLVLSANFSLGRSGGSSLRLAEKAISGRHVVIRYAAGRWFLQDQNSALGTFVNGRRVAATALNNGDRIRIGAAEFEFRNG